LVQYWVIYTFIDIRRKMLVYILSSLRSIPSIFYIYFPFLNHIVNVKDYSTRSVKPSELFPKGGRVSSMRFTTRQLLCFTVIHYLFYVKGVKIVPLTIGNIMTDVSLAFWPMDDGSKAGSGFHFNTYAFTPAEFDLLQTVLLEKFNLVTTIHQHRKGARIYINAQSMNHFRDLVTPYYHPSMLYKLA
jgi:LAGLIDADG DNA endonuclease family